MKLQDIIELTDQSHFSQWHPARENKSAYYTKHEGRLTDDQIEQHLNCKAAFGVYCNSDDAHTTSRVMVFDFDDHDGKGRAMEPTMTLASTLRRLGIPHLIFRSGGGRGFHIWTFFEKAVDWQSIQKIAKEIFDSVDEPKTKFVSAKSSRLHVSKLNAKGKQTHVEHAVEVFPKNNGFSNIALPCGRESKPMRIERQAVCLS